MPTLGSLFDGSGGFPLAGQMCGITPVWASEIEPYPIAVTRSRFPDMKHLGSVTEVNGAEIQPVDIITFGSPCQDMSVAGARAGMKHTEHGADETTRSGLFYEAIRIIEEMRKATNGMYPTFAVWENVPGAFSSNNGEDFRCVLQAFSDICGGGAVPKPEKWGHAGEIVGDGFSVAWRLFDAQYWGVPQRRKRIYLVADFGGERAGKILFERESLSGDSAESGTAGEGTARNAEGSAGRSVRGCYCLQGNGIDRTDTTGCCGRGWRENESYTLNTIDCHAIAIATTPLCSSIPAVYDARGNGDGRVCAVTGDHNNRITDYTTVAVQNDGRKYIVRRLTPLECNRLQGFPDSWGVPDNKESLTDEEAAFWEAVRKTHAEANGKTYKPLKRDALLKWYNGLHTDSAEYKMWGNGIALPNAYNVLKGCAEELEGGNGCTTY